MPIEVSSSGTLITGDSIMYFHHMRVVSALGLEIKTGLKMSSHGSAMALAKDICGSTHRTKKKVLSDMVVWMRATYPNYRIPPSVASVLTRRYIASLFVQGKDADPFWATLANSGASALCQQLYDVAADIGEDGAEVRDSRPWGDSDTLHFFEPSGVPCAKEPADGWCVSVSEQSLHLSLTRIETV